jgi:hypothetical protein
MDDDFYTPIPEDEYYAQFGIGKKDDAGERKVEDPDTLKAAYNKAWEIRNFEITTLWTRVAYFWGLIAAIFAGYIAVMAGEHNQKALAIHLDLYLILLGFLFSVAWLLVIKGSKRWQDNWEAHIDMLEDYISGPLYKTIYCTNKTFFSVTGVNELLAVVVIGVWIMLFAQYLSKNEFDCYTVLSLTLTIIVLLVLLFNKRTSGSGYKTEIREGRCGEFINRNE